MKVMPSLEVEESPSATSILPDGERAEHVEAGSGSLSRDHLSFPWPRLRTIESPHYVGSGAMGRMGKGQTEATGSRPVWLRVQQVHKRTNERETEHSGPGSPLAATSRPGTLLSPAIQALDIRTMFSSSVLFFLFWREWRDRHSEI